MPAEEFAESQRKFPEALGLCLLKSTKYSISSKGDVLSVQSNHYEESLLLKSVAAKDNEEYVTSSSFRNYKNLEAYTLVPQKNSYKKVQVKSFFDRADWQEGIFHNDYVKKEFTYSQLGVGAKKCLSYEAHYPVPQLIDGFWFFEDYPINKAVFQINCDRGVEIGYRVYNDFDKRIRFSQRVEKNQSVYTWEADSLPQIKFESRSLPFQYLIPHVIFYIKSYKGKDGKTVKVLSDLNDLHQYYLTFIKDLNVNKDSELYALTDSITRNIKDETEKVKALFYWVKDNIKYIAIEDGYNGLVPRQAGDICRQRYGDCKDMASIVHEMLKYSGIKSYLTWIGSDALPYSYTDIPSPVVDNHMIVTYISGKDTFFLDATSSETAWGLPSRFIQGKEAFINVDNDRYLVVRVPVIDPERNVRTDSLFIAFNEAALTGRGSVNYSGYLRDDVVRNLYDHSGSEKQDLMKALLEKGNNKFQLLRYAESSKQNRDLPFNISYDFKIDNYATFTKSGIYLNPFLEKPFVNAAIESDRNFPVLYRYNSEERFFVEIDVPENYKFDNLPKDFTFRNDIAEFNLSVKNSQNKIFLSYVLLLKKRYLEKENFADWNNFIDALNKNYTEVISFNRSTKQ